MTETEYLTLENLVRIRAALEILGHVIPGYGLTEKERTAVTRKLYAIQERMSDKIETEEDPEK